MEIIRADNSGFCFGVKQAIKKTEEQIGLMPGRIFTMGPLIHNELVTGDLKKRGVEMIASLDEVEEGDTVIVRSHGEPRSFFDDALAKGIRLVDATCPATRQAGSPHLMKRAWAASARAARARSRKFSHRRSAPQRPALS